MAAGQTRRVSVERSIAAPTASVFAVLADPLMHTVIDGSDTLLPVKKPASSRLRQGSEFITPMRRRLRRLTRVDLIQVAVAVLVRGRMHNTVVEFVENERIAWRNFGRHVWRYELEPEDGCDGSRTLVRETFDYAPSPTARILEWAGFPERNAIAMDQTLADLDKLLTTSAKQLETPNDTPHPTTPPARSSGGVPEV